MSKDKIIISAIFGIFIIIFVYFSFFLLPLNLNVKKLSGEAEHNYKQFKIADNQIKSFNIDQLKSKLDSIDKKINKFSQYKLEESDLPKLLNRFAKIVSGPDINLTLLGIKQGKIRINKKSIVFKNRSFNKRNPVQSTSNVPSPPPPPSSAKNSAPPPPPVPSAPAPSRRKTMSSSSQNYKSGEKIIKWKELPIYIEISGEFIDIAKFFYYLNKIDKIIVEDSISMESDKMNTGKIFCKINLIVLMGETNEKN